MDRGSSCQVNDEVAYELAGGGVDDGAAAVLDEHEDPGAGVLVADADVCGSATDAHGELAIGIDD